MREINVSNVTDVVEKLCIDANTHLPEDVKCAIKNCRACEDGEIAKGVLDYIIENFEIADNENVPICQDTGMACVFLEIGQDVHFVGGDLTDAIKKGILPVFTYIKARYGFTEEVKRYDNYKRKNKSKGNVDEEKLSVITNEDFYIRDIVKKETACVKGCQKWVVFCKNIKEQIY